MKLLVESAMVFLGTLIAAALVALGDPAYTPPISAKSSPIVATKASPVERLVARLALLAPAAH